MTTYIALLRGINVGQVQIKMADLRGYFAAAGCRDVTTYIQSGNVVFGDDGRPRDELKVSLEQQVEVGAGVPVPIVLRTGAEWSGVVAGREVYMHLPDGIGRAKLPTGLAKLGTPVTVRNWNTVLELQEMSR